MSRQKQQLGFGMLGIIFSVAVVIVIVVGGILVYHHDKKSLNSSTATSNTSQSSTQPQSNATTQPTMTGATLDIKEWGVQLKLDSNTASLYYYINPQVPDIAYLSLKSVSNIAPNCAADKVSLGAISRFTAAAQQDALNKHLQAGTIQVGNYWYGFTKPNASCTDGSAAMTDAINKAQPNVDLLDTFKTIQAIPTTN